MVFLNVLAVLLLKPIAPRNGLARDFGVTLVPDHAIGFALVFFIVIYDGHRTYPFVSHLQSLES